jgi:hypothetical protein
MILALYVIALVVGGYVLGALTMFAYLRETGEQRERDAFWRGLKSGRESVAPQLHLVKQETRQ